MRSTKRLKYARRSTKRLKRARRSTKRFKRVCKGGDGEPEPEPEIETKISFSIPAQIYKNGHPVSISRVLVNLLRDTPNMLTQSTGMDNVPLVWSEGSLKVTGHYITTKAKLVTSCKKAVFDVEITVLTNSAVDTLEKATDILQHVFPSLYGYSRHSWRIIVPGEYYAHIFAPLEPPSNIQFQQEDMYVFK
jgi:hypothetical protein